LAKFSAFAVEKGKHGVLVESVADEGADNRPFA
jgi:hypothetical protein